MARIKNIKQSLYIQILIFSIFSGAVFAGNFNFDASVNRNKVSLGSALQLSLNFSGSRDVPEPQLPDIEGFDWRYLGPASKISVVNGRVSKSIIHKYLLIAGKTGVFTIPPITVNYQGKEYSSEPIKVEVVDSRVSAGGSSGQNQAYRIGEKELSDKIFLVLKPEKTKTYIGEQVAVEAKLYIDNLPVKDINYPAIGHKGFSLGKYQKPRQYSDVLGGIKYSVVEFNTTVFATRVGKLTLGPAVLTCNLMIEQKDPGRDDFFGSNFFKGFFGRYTRKPVKIESVPVPINVKPLLEEGQPESFKSAIGRYRMDVELKPDKLKTGDPITLEITIKGDGNLNSVEFPEIDFDPDKFKTYEPSTDKEQRKKVFEQVIIPKTDKIKEIPAVVFSYFDPEQEKYITIKKGPFAVDIKALPQGEKFNVVSFKNGREQAESGGIRDEALGKDIIYIKENPGEFKNTGSGLYKNKLFLFIQLLPLLFVVFSVVFRRRQDRLKNDIRYARRMRAPQKARRNLKEARKLLDEGRPVEFFDAVSKALKEYLGDKFHLPTKSITTDVVDNLGQYEIGRDLLDKLRVCFERCDQYRYMASDFGKKEMAETYELLQTVIDRLERKKL